MNLDFLAHAPFWVALGQIIAIDIVLGGDNAVVIALACRKLPPAQRTQGIVYGAAGAIILRLILVVFAMKLLTLPLLRLLGALLLVWIGVKLMAPEEEEHGNIEGSDRLLAAIKTVIVADVVMSLDNVIAIAGAAQNAPGQQVLLVTLGLLISIPIIIGGSQLIIRLMERFPVIITLGGMLLGWIAGGMWVSDPLFAGQFDGLRDMLRSALPWQLARVLMQYGPGILGALLTLALGKWLAARRSSGKTGLPKSGD